MSERFILILTDEPCDIPTAIRLRLVLKRLLRCYSFRCESIQCEHSKPNEPAENAAKSNADAFSDDGTTFEPSEGSECGKTALEREQCEIEVF